MKIRAQIISSRLKRGDPPSIVLQVEVHGQKEDNSDPANKYFSVYELGPILPIATIVWIETKE